MRLPKARPLLPLSVLQGTHHTKALLLRYPTGLRVIVLTGTLGGCKKHCSCIASCAVSHLKFHT